MVRTLLNRFQQGSGASPVLRYLAPEDMKELLKCEIDNSEVHSLVSSPIYFVKKIHYSWLVPALKQQPQVFIPSFLSVLPNSQKLKLQAIFNSSPMDMTLSDSIQGYLLNRLYQEIKDPEVLPLAILKQTPLSILADFTKNDILTLINLLGIYDLADNMKRIIDKNHLKNIYACLSLKKKQFLRLCMHQKFKINTPPLKLEQWNGDCKILEDQLHQRGMLRLGKALCGQHPHLIWYITHILDTGRASVLLKYYQNEPIDGITVSLTQQVIQVIQFIKGIL